MPLTKFNHFTKNIIVSIIASKKRHYIKCKKNGIISSLSSNGKPLYLVCPIFAILFGKLKKKRDAIFQACNSKANEDWRYPCIITKFVLQTTQVKRNSHLLYDHYIGRTQWVCLLGLAKRPQRSRFAKSNVYISTHLYFNDISAKDQYTI